MELKDVDKKAIYSLWKNNLFHFEPFMRSGPFVSLQTYKNFKINYCNSDNYLKEKYKNKIKCILDIVSKDNFIIVDLPLTNSIELAYLLNNYYNIKPIINFNFLFHDFGLVGNEDDISALVTLGLKLKNTKSDKYILFLDYNRYFEVTKDEYKRKLNNQYEYTSEDFPSVEMLKYYGYSKITTFTLNIIKGDLKDYLILNNNFKFETINWG